MKRRNMKAISKGLRDAVVAAYVADRTSTCLSIGERFALDESTVLRCMRRAGVTRSSNNARSMSFTQKEYIVELYVERKMSSGQIAKLLNLPVSTVSKVIRSAGAARSMTDARRLRRRRSTA